MKKLTFLFLAVVLFSCKKEEDVPAIVADNLQVSEAKLVLIAGTPSGTSNKYYKVVDGYDTLAEVKLTDQFGNAISSGLNATGVYNVNNDFVLFSFTVDGASYVKLINKSTNQAIDLSSYGTPQAYYGTGDMNNNCFRNDQSGNVYYIGAQGGAPNIIKVTTVNPNAVSAAAQLTTPNNLIDFTLDGSGNILYRGLDSTTIKKFNGGYHHLPSDFNFEKHWLDNDGNINYEASDIYQGNYDDNINVYSFSVKTTNSISTSYRKYDNYYLRNGNTLVIFNFYQDKVQEIDNTSHTPSTISTVPVNNFKLATQSKANHIGYLVGDDNSGDETIFKIDLANSYSYTTLLTPGAYEIYDIEAYEDGTLYFTAKRDSDSKYVVGKISSAGTVTIINDELNEPGIQLEKLDEYVYYYH